VVQIPIEFYQVINLKTARALDINIAPSLLAISDGSNERIAAVNWSGIDGTGCLTTALRSSPLLSVNLPRPPFG
jgi:hypothetical protein